MGEMIDDEKDTKAWGEIVLPPLSWTFPSPFLPPPIYDPDFSSSEGETVMDRSHSPLHRTVSAERTAGLTERRQVPGVNALRVPM